MQNGREVYESAYQAGWRPEPRLSVSAWADENRVLGNRAGHAAIHWRTSTTPYLREIMDALGPRSPARRVVFMKGSQLGGTECGNNWLGFVMAVFCFVLVLRRLFDDERVNGVFLLAFALLQFLLQGLVERHFRRAEQILDHD